MGVGCTGGAVCLPRDEPLNVTPEHVAGGGVSDTRALSLPVLVSTLLYGELGGTPLRVIGWVEGTGGSDSCDEVASWLCEPNRD